MLLNNGCLPAFAYARRLQKYLLTGHGRCARDATLVLMELIWTKHEDNMHTSFIFILIFIWRTSVRKHQLYDSFCNTGHWDQIHLQMAGLQLHCSRGQPADACTSCGESQRHKRHTFRGISPLRSTKRLASNWIQINVAWRGGQVCSQGVGPTKESVWLAYNGQKTG